MPQLAPENKPLVETTGQSGSTGGAKNGDVLSRFSNWLGLKQPGQLPNATPGSTVKLGPRRTQYEIRAPELHPRQVAPMDLPGGFGMGGPASGTPPPAQAPEPPTNGANEQAEVDEINRLAAGTDVAGGAINAGSDDPAVPTETLDMEGITIQGSPGGPPWMWIIAGVAALYLWRKK